jgi:transposase
MALQVHQVALETIVALRPLVGRIRRFDRCLCVQLTRAASSAVLNIIDELDLDRIYDHYERELRGKPPHDPRLMVALLLYGYCVGVRSSRQIEKKTHEDVAFRVLAAETHPDHVSISEFRRVHRERLAELFGQVFQLCREAGLVKLGHFSLDGTKVKANASKHKAMSYRRMKQAEGELVKRARALLDLAEQTDRKEDKDGGGMRNFLLRGLQKVRCEWSLACTAHNLRKLFRARRLALTPS